MSSPAPFPEQPVEAPETPASTVDAPGAAPARWVVTPDRPAGESALSARGVRKHYVGGDGSTLTVLDGVDLEVARGDSVSVIGRSGSGKSTLLQVLGGLDEPNAGEVYVAGRALHRLNEEELGRVRSETIGFVFQFHHLLREFTALENVMMPQLIRGAGEAEARDRARELLAGMGLEGRATH